jgi:4-amino-4-deoxy-L-arabinose transferase-like glycosyltransferase
MKRPSLSLPERVGWRDHVIGFAMALVYVGWLLSGARVLGFPRDEGTYFHAASDYFRWYRLLWDHGFKDATRPGVIESSWSTNHEHPALMKTLFGASEYFFHEKWHVFADASTAYRLPAMCVAGVALWVTYLFGARAFSRRAGAIAAALLALMPRIFFHAHLACFDVPIAAMWIWCVYAYWRSVETRSIGWFIAVGVVYGLMLDTKHNAWFFPAVVVPHALFVWGQAIGRSRRAVWREIPWSLLSMAVLGPAVLVLLWPYLWHDTEGRIRWWINFHMNHEFYNIEYLGRNYFGPPSPKSYMPFMIVATVPTITILLFFIGALDRKLVAYRRIVAWMRAQRGRPVGDVPQSDRRETDLLLFLSFGMAVGPWLLPNTPIFGATKHWLPAYPVLAIMAGRGFDLVAASLERVAKGWSPGARAAALVALVASVLVGPALVTAHSHPFGLSAYVPLVSGTQGGADLGLNRQFWGFTTQTAAEQFLNAKAPKNSTVFIHDTTFDAWGRMQEEGRVRSDLRAAWAPGEAMYALVQHELHMSEVDYDIWIADGTDAPAYVVTHDDVPIVSVYKRQ